MGYAAKQNLPETEVTFSLQPVIREVLRRKKQPTKPNQNRAKQKPTVKERSHSEGKEERVCTTRYARRNRIEA